MKESNKTGYSASEVNETTILDLLQARFEQYQHRHAGISWKDVAVKLAADAGKLHSLLEMELSGGEPDVVGYDGSAAAYMFFDCSAETPAGRRSLCYDERALHARKELKPVGSAAGAASAMGLSILNEVQYRYLQTLGEFDLKTSSWLLTPEPIRRLGGAIFADRRYDTVFVYHNGAQSYYASRAFRAVLLV